MIDMIRAAVGKDSLTWEVITAQTESEYWRGVAAYYKELDQFAYGDRQDDISRADVHGPRLTTSQKSWLRAHP